MKRAWLVCVPMLAWGCGKSKAPQGNPAPRPAQVESTPAAALPPGASAPASPTVKPDVSGQVPLNVHDRPPTAADARSAPMTGPMGIPNVPVGIENSAPIQTTKSPGLGNRPPGISTPPASGD